MRDGLKRSAVSALKSPVSTPKICSPLPLGIHSVMVSYAGLLSILVTLHGAATAQAGPVQRATDPCAAIAGQKWVAPQDVRACFTSIQVDPDIKANVCLSTPVGTMSV